MPPDPADAELLDELQTLKEVTLTAFNEHRTLYFQCFEELFGEPFSETPGGMPARMMKVAKTPPIMAPPTVTPRDDPGKRLEELWKRIESTKNG